MDRIHESFAKQGLMRTFGAKILSVQAGACTISAPIAPAFSQQHGAGHAGLTFALGDTAAGYAALSLLPAGREVMTSEIKINLLRPALGKTLIARGRVIKAGQRLIVVQSEVFAANDQDEVQVAILLGTMVPVDPA